MEISELIFRLLKDRIINQCFPGEVLAVDKKNDTCTVRPFDDGPELLEVRLTANVEATATKAVYYPKKGSTVLVGVIDSIKTDAYVCAFSEVEEIRVNCPKVIFNDGGLGGLVLIEKLTERLNRLEERMLTHQHLSAAPGSPTAPDPATNQLFAKTLREEIENKKITH